MTRVHRNEALAEGARRIARTQIAAALRALERRPLSDKAVHSARKSLKKARAMLRLLRPSMGDEAYHRENAALRDIARPLSEVRDARILLEALERLLRGRRRRNRPLGLVDLQRLLRREQGAIRSRLRGSRTFARQLDALREAHRRVRHWRLDRKGWSVLAAGLTRVYGQARRAFTRARADPVAASLHEWRKQTKYLWHQLQILTPLGATVAQRAERAHRLTDALGEDHDLWVLRNVVAARVSSDAARQELFHLIDQRSRQLRARAFTLGRQVYADAGTAFEAPLHALWRKWKREPRRGRPA